MTSWGRVVAFRRGATACRQARPICNRVSSHASTRELQPRCIKERDRRKDQTASRAITSCTLALGGAFQAAHAHKTRVSLQISAVYKQFVWAVGRENWERGQTIFRTEIRISSALF